jgi:hypothetical protein
MTHHSTSTSTAEGVVKAAMSVARDAAEGKLDPASLSDRAVSECRELFSDVVGQDDPLWPLHLDIARQVLALGGVPADELSEWAAALRHRDAEPSSEPQPDDDPPDAISPLSVELSAHDDALDTVRDSGTQPADVETQPAPAAQPAPLPPVRRDEYDPLRGWLPGGAAHRRRS